MKIGKFELTEGKLLAVIAAAALVFALAAYFFIYAPLISKLKIKYAECRSIETDAASAHLVIESAGKIYGERVLIAEDEAYLAIDELTKLGKSHEINFISIDPKGVEKTKELQYKVLPIHMEIQSTYQALASFMGSLDDLEKSVVKVKSFNIVHDKNQPNKFITDLVADVYISGRE